MKTIPMIGKRFGRLTVVSEAAATRNAKGKTPRRWNCSCDCGGTTTVSGHDLRSGHTSSCKCLHKESLRRRLMTHGKSSSQEYKIWSSMLTRCFNKNCKSYKRYGGIGITVCERWKNSFTDFLNDIGTRPSPGHSLDRIDNAKGYEPGNVRWATADVQIRNTKRTKLFLYKGKTLCVSDWADLYGIPRATLISRVAAGWTINRAIETPIRDCGTRSRSRK